MSVVQQDYLISLVEEFRKLPSETEWLEFKVNNSDPEMVGQRIASLSNSSALIGKDKGYLVWGVADDSHEIVGTSFDPESARVGNELLENWLLRLMSPKIYFCFHTITIDELAVVILEIPRAMDRPVQFRGVEYVQIGSYTKPLKDHPERERSLWRVFEQIPFERSVAKDGLSADEVLRLIDYPSYFDLMELDLPSNRQRILDRLRDERLIERDESGQCAILNLGAILFAKNLGEFERLGRKALRVIQYRGGNRLHAIHEQVGTRGYASGFEGLVEFINARIPHNEVLGQALRKDVPMFPELAIRELVANALIHQDFFQLGTGAMIEIFESRIEITNPGVPLIEPRRFLDSPPRSRNEALASVMRRAGICEERGSGIDKVVHQTEVFQLPAPIFENTPEHTRVVLFAHKAFDDMTKTDRVNARYLHSCLRYTTHDYMTNESLRQRFGLPDEQIARASRIISAESGESRKYAKYVPYWAA